MTWHQRFHGASRRSFLAALAFLLLAGLLSTGPAAAHTFTRNDANDSPSKIDLRSVSVSHTSTSVVHSVRTWNSWTPASLQHDSIFVIGINKDDDPAYERCAFIYYTNRLRGQLSNCRAQFIRFLTVAKVNATTAKVTIPKTELTPAYTWYGSSFWVGAAPCQNVCRDFAPNTLPDIFHDLSPPVIVMSTDPLFVFTFPEKSFTFRFSVQDAHGTPRTWRVERRLEGTATWTEVAAGSGGGDKSPTFLGEPGRWRYRVVATDAQGNIAIKSRPVMVPLDNTELDPSSFNPPDPTSVVNSLAYGQTYAELALGASFNYMPDADAPCQFVLIGPGGGSWTVQVTIGGDPYTVITGGSFPAEQRLSLLDIPCTDSEIISLTVTDGSGFGVDAIIPT